MKVEIIYFKPSGKYYTSDEHEFAASEWNAIVDEARAMLARGEWPGLTGALRGFSVLLNMSPPHMFPAEHLAPSFTDETRGDAQTWGVDEQLVYELLDAVRHAQRDPDGPDRDRTNAQWFQDAKRALLDELSCRTAAIAEERHVGELLRGEADEARAAAVALTVKVGQAIVAHANRLAEAKTVEVCRISARHMLRDLRPETPASGDATVPAASADKMAMIRP